MNVMVRPEDVRLNEPKLYFAFFIPALFTEGRRQRCMLNN